MESWEYAPIDTLTPKQRLRRETREREESLRKSLGFDLTRTCESIAIRTLCDDRATIFDLALAVEGLDRDDSYTMSRWSNDNAFVGQFAEAARTDPRANRASVAREVQRLLRREKESLDIMIEQFGESRTPADILRTLLIDGLITMGVRIDHPRESRCCRRIVELLRDRSTYRSIKSRSQIYANRLSEIEETLAQYYGIAS